MFSNTLSHKVPAWRDQRGQYPLTPSQQRMWIINRLNGDSTAYNSPVVRKITGELNVRKLKNAFVQLVQRHEQLRTAFVLVGDEPVQYLQEVDTIDFTVIDHVQEADLQEVIAKAIQPFQLKQAPLMRAVLYKLTNGCCVLLTDMHHIISDLRSENILINDLFRLYNQTALPDIPVQYKEYAVWLKENGQAAQLKEEEADWLSKLSGELPVLQLPADFNRPPVFNFEGTILHFPVTPELAAAIRQTAAANNTAIYRVCLTALFVLLNKYTFQEDIIVGMPREVRPEAEMAAAIGLFINTLPVRALAAGGKTFREILQETDAYTTSALNNFRYDVGYLVEKLHIKRDPSRNPLYDVLFFHQQMSSSNFEQLQVTPVEFIHHKAELDLTFGIIETDNQLHISIEYYTGIFKQATIEKMNRHYQQILTMVTANPDSCLKDIQMISDAEKTQLLHDFHPFHPPFPAGTIDQLFEQQAAAAPQQPALRFKGHTITYQTLNERANQLAWTLLHKGIVPGDVVALLVTPSVEMIVAIMGVLKAGAAYLPIDPGYPEERITHMLATGHAVLLLTAEKLPDYQEGLHAVVLDLHDPVINTAARTNPAIPHQAHATAYVMYTSGTTGQAKGICVRHSNVVRMLADTPHLNVLPADRVLQLANYVFDGSVYDIFSTLLNGGTLVLVPAAERQDIARLITLFREENISFSFFTTALFNTIVDNAPAALAGLRKAVIGGEKASVVHARRALEIMGPGKLINMYGPTETTVYATYFVIAEVPADTVAIPIGPPAANTRLFVLNGNTLLPPGIPGELCIGGAGLTAGYLDETLMEGVFETLPFSEGTPVYRSGDIVKWREDGMLDFIGRRDTQVKIRGHRIETAEIEVQLYKHPLINQVAVIVKEDARQDKYLQAYYTTAPDKTLLPEELRVFLSAILPAYMVPASFTVLTTMPLTGNDKLDYRALQSLSGETENITVAYIPPTSPTEIQLAAIWHDILKKDKISITRNFFECGGHSLTATILSIRIQEAFNISLPLTEVMQQPTIAGLAVRIAWYQAQTANRVASITRAKRRRYYPLGFSETMIYLHQHATQQNHTYCSVFPMWVNGTPDRNKLQEAIKTVIQRHEVFRTAYVMRDGKPFVKIWPEAELELLYQEGSEADIVPLLATLRAPYLLEKPPLFRAALLKIDTDKYLLALANHHIVSDGVTETLFMREISRLYQGEKLKRVPLQYKDYTMWQQAQWEGGYFQSQEKFWLQHLRGPLPVLELPTDFKRPAPFAFDSRTIYFDFPPQLSRQLHDLAGTQQTTLFILLFTAYTVLLHKYTDQEDLIVGIPMANRPYADQQELAGMLVNMVAWRNYPAPDKTFRAYLEEVKAAAIDIYQHQEYPFEKLISLLPLERDASRNPLFDTIFVLQNMGAPVLDIPGLHMQPYPDEGKMSKVDLTVEVTEEAGALQLNISYCNALFRPDTIHRLGGHFIQLLTDLVAAPGKTLKDLQLLTQAEQQQLLVDFNQTSQPYPRDQTLYDLFAQQVRLHPGKAAVRMQDITLTYEELDKKATFYADRLLQMGVSPGQPVALITSRSPEMIIGIWAILRAGGAYVPIDPEYPDERVEQIMADSTADITVTTFDIYATYRYQGKILIVDNDAPVTDPITTTFPEITPESLAYIMYTSGSSGTPKGIGVQHYNVIRTVTQTNYITLTPADNLLQVSNFAFDGSVFDIFGALLNGAGLVMLQQTTLTDGNRLAALIRDSEISVMYIPTALFNVCIDTNPACFAPLRKIFFGGEQASAAHVKKALAHLGADKLVNVYGPTETTVFTTFYPVTAVAEGENIPIGRPLANTKLYVLNNSNALNPIGVPGELYIGGDGISTGYWDRPALTREKFSEQALVPGTILYRTGDRVKWLPDGNLVFTSRTDDQVKIRGFRIELGEIETALGRYPDITHAVVTIKENNKSGEKHLCAWYVSDEEIRDETLRSYMGRLLPHYMMPEWFIRIDRLPLTSNGKTDRKALTADNSGWVVPEKYLAQLERQFVAPESETEKQVAGIWCEVFGLDRVGVQDNFYSLGGHSLKALQIVNRLQQQGYAVAANDLFNYPTVYELAAHCVRKQTATVPRRQTPVNKTVDLPAGTDFPLSAVQARFFQREMKDRNIFNSPFTILLQQPVPAAQMATALNEIQQVHQSLLLRFRKNEAGTWTQFYKEDQPEAYFRVIDVSGTDKAAQVDVITKHCQALQLEFDITTGPLFKVLLFENYQEPGKQVLFFLVHHLLFDGISWEVFIETFRRRCLNMATTDLIQTASYRDWCVRLNSYAQEHDFTAARAYWKQVLAGQPFMPDAMPTPYPVHRDMAYIRATPLRTAADLTALQQAVHHYQANIFNIQLAAFYCACQQVQHRNNLLINILTAQRESFFDDIRVDSTVGFFAGAYPVCITAAATHVVDYPGVIKAVKESLLGVPKAGLDYLVLNHLVPDTTIQTELKQDYPVLFHYLNLISLQTENGFYQPLELPVGITHSLDNPSSYLLNITATLTEGGLQATFYYSSIHFRESVIQQLSAAFEHHLLQIIHLNK
ncbi:non-ribosomal peptide synthetase [Chitinophaga nivalis]|uniref:Amino acid adenylation domain-containing protein n=1 Tax=Chitinophaga nivalis TaxID=2991709 RepID=A0ABT3IM10_9BACT|nr:non-ribosomal peptide synthetase [Chitinophaga nivalis]MCW3465320.1 amino acid adenylation domain-containing protein [Chitinophaga nivalis]MCW3484988.1 amino acid adenylation domain-containing protein [Chitinophaga nivalis]